MEVALEGGPGKGIGTMHRVAFDRLPNGLRLVVVERPHLHRSVLSTYIEVGSRHETPRTNGLSHFLEHMLFRGTERHPTAWALNDAIERMGGSLGATTHSDYTLFDLSVPPDSLATACQTMGSILSEPVFSQIDVEKGIVREEILEDLDEQHRDVNVDNLSRKQVFASHPLGYPITGTLANVERFTVRDLRAWLQKHYCANNMVVSVCSPLPRKTVLKAIEKGFSSLPSGEALAPQAAKVTQRRGRFLKMKSAGSQACVRIAFPTPGEDTRMARAVEVLMRVLDDGMSTRLHRRICDELGLAYEVSAGVELFRDVGIADVASSVAQGSVPRLVWEVLSMLSDLAIEGPSRAELEKVQHRYAFDLDTLDDDPSGLADFYGASALWNHQESVELRRREVLALRPEEIRRAAHVVFTPMRLNLAIVGTLDAATRKELSAVVRRYRERFNRRLLATAMPRKHAPPTRIRDPFAPVSERQTASWTPGRVLSAAG